MIQPRRLARPFWTFAAGVACAMAVFVVGLLAGGADILSPRPSAPPLDAELVTRTQLAQLLRDQHETFETRLAAVESRPVPTEQESDFCLTREQFASELDNYRQEFDYTQERDFRILAGQIGAVEQRAATWIDQNRDALRLALRYRGVDEH